MAVSGPDWLVILKCHGSQTALDNQLSKGFQEVTALVVANCYHLIVMTISQL